MKNDSYDMIIINGNVITMNDNNFSVEAVAVRGGIITAVGNNAEIKQLAGSGTKVIDLEGKTMLPGFIDAHTHVDLYGMMTSDYVVQCHIPPLKNVDDILEKIKERTLLQPKGDLIICQGRIFQPHPNKEQLDKVAPEHPVVYKPSMHYYILNSLALEKYNITKNSPSFAELFEVDPGGKILRDAEGNPTGEVIEGWNYMFPKSQSPFNYEITKQVLREGLYKHLKYGVTSIAEFMDFPESPRIYQELHRAGELKMRLQLIPCFHGLHKTVELDEIINAGLATGFGNEWIKFGGVKIFVDRQSVTTCASAQLNEWFSRAHNAGLRVYMHAITRAAQDLALAAIECESEKNGLEAIKKMRHRIEHMGSENYDPVFLDRLKRLGAIGFPTAYFINTLPLGAAKELHIFKTMMDMGLCVPGSSDGGGAIPEAPNPWYQIWCMVNRKSMQGELICPSEKISVRDALKLYTVHSAYAACEEDIKGSIEIGKLADFTIISDDPFKVPEDDLVNIVNLKTILNGQVVYDCTAG
jgi:predicted amidohydrolase YtcJ